MTAITMTMGNAGRIRTGSGLRRFVLAVWVAALAMGGAALAQEGPEDGPGSDPGGADPGALSAPESGPEAGFSDAIPETVDELLSDFLLRQRGYEAPSAAASAAASAAPSATAPSAAELEDDGVIGLIEAPEGASAVAPGADPFANDSLAADPLSIEGLAASGSVSFAETQPQARALMPGPVGHPPVVVELFTSQGCSSCPPADEMLGDLADREDVLALSWHVDYWDYLGWADQFARPEFTRRQQAYARASGERAIYTPQIIVGGTDTLIALRPAELIALLQAQIARPTPVMVTSSQQENSYRIEMTPRAAIPGRVAIILVRYAPNRKVTIQAGENRGMDVEYRNVVLAVERIAEWDGRVPLRMTVRPGAIGSGANDAFPPDTRHAILAQQMDSRSKRASGPILAAIRLD